MSNKMLEVDTLPVDQDVVIILDQPKGPSDTSLIKQSITSGDLYRVQEIVSDEYLCIGDLKKLTSCLALATEKNQVAIVSFLLQVGVPYSINQVRIAVDNCSIEIIDLFLAHDYNINEAIDWATPPLLCLAIQNHDFTEQLLIRGADPNARSKYLDVTPLSVAVATASIPTIKLLFKHHGSVLGGQLLHYAAMREDGHGSQVLDYLLEQGVTGINHVFYSDEPQTYQMQEAFGLGTPLHCAARSGDLAVVCNLLNRGADASIKDSCGRLAVDAARFHKHDEVVQVLEAEGIGMSPFFPL